MSFAPADRRRIGISLAALLDALLSGPAYADTPLIDPPSATTLAVNKAAGANAPFTDRRDLDFAARGWLGSRKDPLIRAADGHVVWNLDAYRFTDGPAPATVSAVPID